MEVRTAEFIGSQSDYQKCPPATQPEFAFVGRSNVGKSSLINMLTSRKSLARISGTPGKTQLINHFLIDSNWFLVDLPGYGWARASKSSKQTWDAMVKHYLLRRENLVCSFVLIDIRHKFQKTDRVFLQWMGSHRIPFAIIFTKSDKISKNSIAGNVKRFKDDFALDWEEMPSYFVSSASQDRGREQILDYIRGLSRAVNVN